MPPDIYCIHCNRKFYSFALCKHLKTTPNLEIKCLT
jgi:hypothetical protein